MEILNRHLRRCLVVALLLATSGSAAAQQKLLTLDDIYGPTARVNFAGHPPLGLTWIDASHYAWPRDAADGDGVQWMKVDATSGATQPLFDAAKASAARAKLPGGSSGDAPHFARSRDPTFHSTHTAAVSAIASDM